MTKNTQDLYFDFSILPIYICVRTTTLQTSNFNFRLVQYINQKSKHSFNCFNSETVTIRYFPFHHHFLYCIVFH